MRIAQVAPLFESVPPALYGGSERVVSWLTEELVALGHEVTLFASGDSKTSAKLVSSSPKALWRDSQVRETLPHHVLLVEEVLRRAAEFDVIHFHCDYVHFPLISRCKVPSITTMHGLIHPRDHLNLFSAFPEVKLVSISNSQRTPIPNASWCGTVYHGMPPELHSFQAAPQGYLLFLGRISPDKGVERAIEIATRSKRQLKIAAKIYDEDRAYFERKIEPLVRQSEQVEYIGEVGGIEKNELLGNASGLLFPIQWEEPFGLVLIEALACGTPVIAWNRGSVPEIIENTVHGYIVEDISQAVAAVERLKDIRRDLCRKQFEDNFTVTRMALKYLEIYRAQVQAGRGENVRDGFSSETSDAGCSYA